MKKIKRVLIVFLVALVVPIVANAKEAVNIYIFKGETCGFCAKAISFLNTLKEDSEYGSMFNLVEYEIWNDKDNNKLANYVAKQHNEKLDGVPYIVIGEKTFDGYTTSYDEDIKKAIKEYYENFDGTDEVANIVASGEYKKEDANTDTIIAIVIIGVSILGLAYVIYLSRKEPTVKEPVKKIKEEHEEKTEEKVEVKKEEKEETEKPKKTTTTKKTTSNSKKKTTKKTKK